MRLTITILHRYKYWELVWAVESYFISHIPAYGVRVRQGSSMAIKQK